MFGKKNELETSLFDKAMEWYRSGDSGKRAAALDLFPEDMLEREMESFKKRDKKERLKTREEQLRRRLEEAKKMFPMGSLIWSDEGTDNCPNIIVGEPYIGDTQYGSKIPDDIYSYEIPYEERKTILVHTIRIYRSDIVGNDLKYAKGIVGLEKLMVNMEKPFHKRYPSRESYFIKLEEYYKSENEEKNNNLNNLKKSISISEERIQELKKDLSEWENYDPNSLTKEKINKLVEKYKW